VVIGSRVDCEHAIPHSEAQQRLYRISRAFLPAQFGAFASAIKPPRPLSKSSGEP
jgi:hypothetical protein